MPKIAKVYVTLVVFGGTCAMLSALLAWRCNDPHRYLVYLALALVASALKVVLPGVRGTFSLNFLFILISIVELSGPETVILGAACGLVQCLWRPRQRPTFLQAAFNATSFALASFTADALAHMALGQSSLANLIPLICFAAFAYFLTNTLLVSGVVALIGRESVCQVWRRWHAWSLPYYLVGAALAGLVVAADQYADWRSSLLVMPVMYLLYAYYRAYVADRSSQPPV